MEPYFTMEGKPIYYKCYVKEKKLMLFYTKDLFIHASISEVDSNYSWEKCKKLFGD